MNFYQLCKLAQELASLGIVCLRFTCRTPNFQFRVKCYAAVVVSVVHML